MNQEQRAIFYAAIRRGLEKAGAEEAERIRDEISVPVERSGSVVIRSLPGEPPRLDRGVLASGIRFEIVDGEDGMPELSIISEGEPGMQPTWLEYGTSRMAARPYMRPALDRLAARVPQILQAALDETFGPGLITAA